MRRDLYRVRNSYNDFFRRRTYLGVRRCGNIEVEGAHPAAIDAESFARVQEILDGRLQPRLHPEVVGSPYLLSGLLVCGYCGETIIGQTDSRKRGTRTYVCNTKKRRGRSCRLKRCPAWLLEQLILDAVRGRVLQTAIQLPLLDEINSHFWSDGVRLEKEIARADGRIMAIERC